MQDRKIKRVTPGAVQEHALLFGKTLNDTVSSKFQIAVFGTKTGSCTPVFERIATEQASELKARIRRFAFSYADSNSLEPKLKDLFLAYKYSAQHNQPLEANVQKLADTAFYTSTPILVQQNCSGCHKEPAGSAIGIMVTQLTKKEIIRHIDIKALKPK